MSSASLAGEYVTDTVGLVLRLEGRQMGAQAQAIFAAAEARQTVIYVPAMVLAEILYLQTATRTYSGAAAPAAFRDDSEAVART